MHTIQETPPVSGSSLTAGRLPSGTTPATLVVALVVASGIMAITSGFSIAASLVVGVLLFLLAMHVMSWSIEGHRKATDRTMRHLATGFFILALVPLLSLILSTFFNGLGRLDMEFLTYSMRNILGEGGGAIHAIWGTLIVTGIATLISVPIGLFTAIYLVEYGQGKRLSRSITFFVDVMTGIPSIVAGLFAYTVFSIFLGSGYKSGISGSVALSILMIPTVVRSAEEMLRIVPNELREASYALGVPKWRTIARVVLPTALAGIITGVVLAIARVIGETAPLLVTASVTASMNLNPLSNPMMTLPVFVYNQYMYAPGIDLEAYQARAWTGALILIVIVMVLNVIGRLIAWKFAPKAAR